MRNSRNSTARWQTASVRPSVRKAAVNVLVILDFFALRFSFEVEDQLNFMRPLFDSYFSEEASEGNS